jgi:hypothetical protein
MGEQSNALKESALSGYRNQGLANAEIKVKDFGPSFKYNNELKEKEAETAELTLKLNGLSAPNAETPQLRRHSVPVTPQMENGTSLRAARLEQRLQDTFNKCEEVEELIKRYDKMERLRKELAEIEMYVMNRKLSVASSERSKLKTELSRLESQNRCLLVVSIILCLLLAVATMERFTHILICLM